MTHRVIRCAEKHCRQDNNKNDARGSRDPQKICLSQLRCDALDIQIQSIVHKQDLCTIQKRTRESHVSILKRLYLSDISCGT